MSAISEHFAGLPPLQRAYLALEEMQSKLEVLEQARSEPIAIVGIGCRFPGGADGPERFWRLLRDGVDAVSEVPPDRWDVNAFYDPDPAKPGKTYSRWGSFVNQVDQFDPYFFGISPREAASMDPQQRLLLEVAWEALENAGLPADRLAGSQTGVFVGIYNSDYAQLQHEDDAYSAIGSSLGVAPGRLSYVFDFHGPSVLVDTLCSSSLVAVHLACQSLRRQECQLALAGGVNLILTPLGTILSSRLMALAPDGRCKTFDARANGYVRGEGCGVVALKRLSDAARDGDRIWAIIRGSAVNQDGRSTGLTAPNQLAQQAVIRQALNDGGVAPEQVGYVEAHGTGTSLGDPIEVEALKAVYGQPRSVGQGCALGSIKTNLGHLEAAAGIAGLIKAVLALHQQAIPPHLHLRQLNPRIDLSNTCFTIPTTLQPWERGSDGRFAGVSAFGLSGTNAHVVLEEAPRAADDQAAVSDSTAPFLLPLSARTPQALRALAGRYASVLAEPNAPALAALAAAAGSGRSHFACRAAIVTADPREALAALDALAADQPHPALQTGSLSPGLPAPRVVFACAGQGGQWPAMAQALLADPIAAATLQQVAQAAPAGLDWELLALLSDPNAPWLERIDQLQPILFALQLALAARLQVWGVAPAAVVGHSFGEVAAAYLAGALGLPEAMRVICARSRALAQRRGQGAMALVELSSEAAQAALAGRGGVTIAGVNGPRSTVLTGDPSALQALLAELTAQGIFCRSLAVDVAAHSPQLDDLLPGLAAELAGLQPQAGRLPIYSTVTGQVVGGAALDGNYWARNLRAPVRFWEAVQALVADGHTIFVELGPHPTLAHALEDGLRALGANGQALAPLRRDQPAWDTLLAALGALYCAGVAVAWPQVAPQRQAAADLPTYPFQRERCWVTAPEPSARATHTEPAGTHLLLGVPQVLATPTGAQLWTRTLGRASLPFLADHQVEGLVVLSGAAFVELFLAAAAEHAAGGTLTGVTFAQMLVLPENGKRELQTFLMQGPNATVEVWSRLAAATDTWTRHAFGTVLAETTPAAGAPGEIERNEQILARCRQEIAPADFYQALAESGLTYGPSFRGVAQLWRGDNEAFGRLQLPEAVASDASSYQIHPALLDSCFQVFAAALPRPATDVAQAIYLPVSIARLQLERHPSQTLWVHARLDVDASDPDTFSGSLVVSDEAEQTVIEINGFTVRRLALSDSRAGRTPVDDWLYSLAWRPQARPAPLPDVPAPATWLVFADNSGLGEALASGLVDRGDRCVVIIPRQDYRRLNPDHYQLDPAQPEGFHRLLKEISPSWRTPLHGVVYLWGLDVPRELTAELDPAVPVTEACSRVLYLTQALAQAGWRDAPRLWMFTRGAQAVEPGQATIAPVGAAIWGFANTIALEHPEFGCTRIDLSPSPLPGEADELVSELWSGDEDRVSLRESGRYVARLTRGMDISSTSGDAAPTPAGERAFRLEMARPGILDGLALRAIRRRTPGPGEVEIAVEAAGLNFLDVLGALAARPDPVNGAPALGGECAGRITAVGAGVTDLRVDDAVVAIAPWSFGTYVITTAAFVVPKPPHLTFAEAATIPIAFLTAYYALHKLAHVQPGERVLIHSAATGTGLAALQIAQRAGAKVFATAGSVAKRAFLQEQGVAHIADSRNLSFADLFHTATGGQGVDVVLNALSGPAVERSLALLAPYGRFLEIGKKDIYQNAQIGLEPFKNSLSYFAVDLLGLALRRPAVVTALLRKVMALFAEGELRPLPLTTYPIARAVEAFHTMAQAQHIGKLVLTFDEKAATPITPPTGAATIHADGSYLITGGLGGLGLQVASWLVAQGARHLALLSRSAPTGAAATTIEALSARGAQVLVLQADVAATESMEAAFGQLRTALPPLRGVIHAAAVLDDGLLLQLTPERLAAVLAPKVAGAWNLHTLTRHDPLDFFVLFSSTAGLLGSPGQGHYAAANTFLDGLAHHRRAHGLAALSINWGPWAEVGLAAAQANRGQRLAAQGLASLTPTEGLAALAHLLGQPNPQVAVMKFNVRHWCQLFPQAAELPLLRELVDEIDNGAQPRAASGTVRAALLAAEPGARRTLLEQHLIEQIAQVLRADPGRISAETPLHSLGMDSLMALELRNRLELSLGLSLPATLVWGRPTVVDLAPDLAQRMGLAFEPDQPAAWPESETDTMSNRLESSPLSELSDQDATDLLTQKLAALGKEFIE